MERNLVVLDAPSQLGLRPPEPGAVPGCHKAPGVLRDAGLAGRLAAEDAGVVTPPRYLPDLARNAESLARYSDELAVRLEGLLGEWLPVVLGGDCGILVGIGLALRRRGRYGLVSFDGLDYRHPGHSDRAGAAAGESLALLTGKGGPLAELDGVRPYVDPGDVVAIGLRRGDEYAVEAATAGLTLIDAPAAADDPEFAAATALQIVDRDDVAGFWVHVDADVLDPSLLPAVDSPEPGGLTFEQLVTMLRPLVGSPRFAGLDLTGYDPDLDPGFAGGRHLADVLVEAFSPAPR